MLSSNIADIRCTAFLLYNTRSINFITAGQQQNRVPFSGFLLVSSRLIPIFEANERVDG
jgi:hypothetical protein